MNALTLSSLALYFIAMIGIGLYAWRKSTDTSEGYLLAGRSLRPSVAALSAGASDMSGWLLLGLPGALYAAGIDVFEQEPVPADNPLIDLPNVVLAPHIGSATVITRARMADIAVENVLAALQGDAMPHCVNPEVYS